MRLRGFRLWLLAFSAFFLMIGGWALSAPYDGSADEHDHIYRAVGIYNGDIAPEPAAAIRGSGGFVHVPRGLVVEQCWQFHQGLPASCAREPGSDRTTVVVGSGAGRYQPVYYALVGLPLKLWPGWSGVLLARLISGAGAAALLAGALTTIVTYFRRRYMLAGLLVAVTPMALHFFGAVNPNGLEIAAGVAFFTAIVPLVLGRVEGVPKALVALAGISGILLASLRPTGLIYLLFAAIAFFLPLRRETVARLWASVAARWWIGGIAFAGVFAVAYTLAFKGTYLGDFRQPVPFARGQAALWVFAFWGEWANQLVGVFGWLDTYLPNSIYVIWHLLAGAVLVFGFAFGQWIDRWRLSVLLVGAVGVPTFMQFWFLNDTGFITQGRYMLPGLAGVMIFAAWVFEERDLQERAGRALTRLILAVVVPIHLFSLLWAAIRWRGGIPEWGKVGIVSLWPMSRGWQPPLGAALPVILLIVGLAGMSWLIWKLSVAAVAVSTQGGAPGVTEEETGTDRDEQLATQP